ncbi:DUF885 domain-containing protein [Alteromonas sediminis]|uniref:DUF885 domain-containing protein n=1 Tax=Alteromonas sediminis TaxID=2259342 RepID=A0A3N5XY68_9ALTE|nr:DUF885 domain-containing protein [Alteromonas sediminis]RPJ65463.1 DUF885 domain-containing protein [Alteromonas sediminis]
MKRVSKVLSILLGMALMLSHSVSAASDEEQRLNALLDEIWQYELSVSPLLASREGRRDFDHLLPDLSETGLEAKHKQFTAFVQQLDEIADAGLSTEGRINKIMQAYRLNNLVSSFTFNRHYVPLTSEYGFHSALSSLPNLADLSSSKGIEDYLARLAAIPEYFDQNIAWMRKGIAVGMTQPKIVMKGFEDTVDAFIVEPEKSVFFTPLKTLPAHLDDQDKDRIKQTALAIIAEQVIPAYQAYHGFLTKEYIPNAMDKVGAIHWPKGQALYEERAQHYTTTRMSAREIHNIGLSEVKRIRAEMQSIIDELEFEGTFADFITFLRTDPQFYAKTPEELLIFASYVAKQMDAKLPSLFEKLPRTPYGVAPVPDAIAPKYTTGRYISPRNDREPGYYWVNTYALDKRPLYAIPALTLHEAVPGHHMQIMLANENTDLPPVRKTYISAFGEGWGLYSEFLGVEAGIYRTPYEDFGRLSYEMWRACRLVVDTGMHMFGWSRQQAVDYMLENTALSEHNVNTEIDRYISWPAQALAYKLGEIMIRDLRTQAEAKLGEKFDIRAFHTAVLEHGSIPLFVLEENLQLFMDANEL